MNKDLEIIISYINIGRLAEMEDIFSVKIPRPRVYTSKMIEANQLPIQYILTLLCIDITILQGRESKSINSSGLSENIIYSEHIFLPTENKRCPYCIRIDINS